MPQDILADTPEIFVDIGIGVAQDCESLLPQELVADFVGLFAGKVVMLRAVQLDDQFLFSNVEIHDVGADDFLTVDSGGELHELGLTVLRYANSDIDQNFRGVCEDILSHLD